MERQLLLNYHYDKQPNLRKSYKQYDDDKQWYSVSVLLPYWKGIPFPPELKEYRESVIRQGLHVVGYCGLMRSREQNDVKCCYQVHSLYVGYDQIVDRVRFDLNICHCYWKVLFLHHLKAQSVFHHLLTIVPFHHWHGDWIAPKLMHHVGLNSGRSRRG